MTRVSALQAPSLAFATPSTLTNLESLMAGGAVQLAVMIAEKGD